MKPARSKLLRKTPGKSRSGSLREEPVEVYCRIKPIPPDRPGCIAVISPTTVQLSSPDAYRSQNKEIQYTFSQVFDEEVTQKEVFDIVALPLVSNLIAGKNGLLFTYGVTGSGKTFTMNGEPHNGGIMPRCLDVIFNSIGDYKAEKHVFKPDRMNGFDIQDKADVMLARQNEFFSQNAKSSKTPRRKEVVPEMDGFHARTPDDTKVESVDEDYQYAIFVTYIEIYNNNVYDLLDEGFEDQITRKLQNKLIREDAMRNMYVHGVTEVEVRSPEEAFQIFYKGQRRKTMAHTNLNVESSRSHSIFTIRLVQAPCDADGENVLQSKETMTVSQLSLVDLAGSERTNRTKNTGQRLREAGNINNSLMTLRQCMEVLRENQKNNVNKMVPYRECKLTHLFKNYFDGEGQVRMIVCVNPQIEDYDENVHVLKFAEITQEVQVTKPNPSKPETIGLTPGRRRANRFVKKAVEEGAPFMEIKEFNLDPDVILNVFPPFPGFYLADPEDEDTLRDLVSYLERRISVRNAALEDLEKRRYDVRRKIEEAERTAKELVQENEDKDMIISQYTLEKEKVKEKCVSKIAAAKQKLTREMQMKINREREEYQNKVRDQQEKFRFIREFLSEETTPKVTPRTFGLTTTPYLNTNSNRTPMASDGTPHVPQNPTPSQGHLSRRGVAVSNPRHRRSRSAGGGDCWLDHRPGMPIELNTVFQPSMKKRKSVTKLTDVKDIVNSKTSKYCLTTQEQDTDGELETKLYKGDVIPTTGGGAQVVLNDVELLKQLSPTSEATSRKRSLRDGINGNTESRCAVSIEGHSKRSKS